MDTNINPQPPQEFFDLPLNLIGWEDEKDNYRIVAELIPKTRDTTDLIKVLDEVNQILGEKKLPYIFDGTVESLKFLIDNHGLNISKIKNPLLKESIKKNLYNSEKSKEIKMNPDRWSGQALRCKAALVGLHMKNGRLRVPLGKRMGFEELSEYDFPVFDEDIREGKISAESEMRLTSLNATWSMLSQLNPWSKDKVRGIDQLMVENMMSSHIKGTDLNTLFTKLQLHINVVANKYFPGFHETDHRACVAIRHAATIVLYRTIEYMPKAAKRHPDFRVDGFLNKWMEYIFTAEFELQDWFIKYLTDEMDKRIRFLKMMADAEIYMEIDENTEALLKQFWGEKYKPPRKNQLYYPPVFESFRFVPPGSIPMFGRLVTIFHDRNISTGEKEEIAKTIIFNIQKLVVSSRQTSKANKFGDKIFILEKLLREAFMMLVLNILVPLARNTARYFSSMTKNEFDELKQIIDTETLISILKYDATKNQSFFGYIKVILPLNVKSALRENKTVQESYSLEEMMDSSPNKFASDANFDETVNIDILQKKLAECLEKLSEKEKRAIEKAFYANKRLNDTERRAKNRGIQKLKTQFPELKELIP